MIIFRTPNDLMRPIRFGEKSMTSSTRMGRKGGSGAILSFDEVHMGERAEKLTCCKVYQEVCVEVSTFALNWRARGWFLCMETHEF